MAVSPPSDKINLIMRQGYFAEGEYYHIYNRGVDKREIFSDTEDVERFLQSMKEFNVEKPIGSLYENSFREKNKKLGGETAKLIEIITYCLNRNHYHFIIEALSDNGVSEFMKRLNGGYTWFFNNKYKRSGALFQGVFKSVHVNTNEYLLYLSAYVNLNDRVHKLGGETAKLVKSSMSEYIEETKGRHGICKKNIILDQFKNIKEYEKNAKETIKEIVRRRKEDYEFAKLLLE